MIKALGTGEGLTATTELIARGINVNVTLLCSVDRYLRVFDAHCSGIENAEASRRSIERISSVASFFRSRIDSTVDPLLDQSVDQRWSDADEALRRKGEIAIGSARRARRFVGS